MKRLGWVLTPWAFCLGCNLFDNGARTLVVEPVQYCAHKDEHRTHAHNEKLAQDAWCQFCAGNQGHEFSKDYVCGFSEGFADYLDAGGSGDPPPLPPRHYWDQHCQEGSLDWFAGFRMGAGLAQRSGLRQCIPVPTESRVCRVCTGAVPVYTTPGPQQMTPPMETIPMPNPNLGPAPGPGPAQDTPVAPLPSNLPLPSTWGNSHESR